VIFWLRFFAAAELVLFLPPVFTDAAATVVDLLCDQFSCCAAHSFVECVKIG
jgi:hypothetical protein